MTTDEPPFAESDRRILTGGEIIEPSAERGVDDPRMAKALDDLRQARDDLVRNLRVLPADDAPVAYREGPSFTVDTDHSWIEAAGFETVRHAPPVGSVAVGAPGFGFGLLVPDEDSGRFGLVETYGPDLHLTSPQHPALHVEGADPLPGPSGGLPSLDDLIGAAGTPEGLPGAPEPKEIPEGGIPGEVHPGTLVLDPLPVTAGDHVITAYRLQAWCEVHQTWHPAATR